MDYRQQIFEIIAGITGQNNVLTIQKEFVNYTGDLETALFLNQLIFWTDKTKNKEGFIYKTYSEWETEIGLNEYKIRRCKKTLEQKGILETKIKKANGSPTVHYRLDTIKFSESILQFLKERNCKNSSIHSLNFTGTIDSANFKESITEDYNTIIQQNITTYNSVELDKALNDFYEMRIKTKKPMTDRAKKLLISELNKLSSNEQEQIEIINQSIINNWKSVYPLKDGSKKTEGGNNKWQF